MARKTAQGTGDGDTCPVDRSHGQMLVLTGGVKQYCPHQTHDGVWTEGPGRTKTPPSRNLWPLQFFDKAVATYNDQNDVVLIAALPELDDLLDLPDLDMEALLA